MLHRKLSYAWRLPATGFAFVVLGLGGLLLASLVFPAIGACTRDPLTRARRVRSAIRLSFRAFARMLQAIGVIRLQVVGRERLAECRGTLVVANHPTLLDVVLLMALAPDAQCVVKHQLWRNPFLGPVVRGAGYIRNDVDADAFIARCREATRAGGNIIIFPEGTRSAPGKLRRFQRGFASIALLAPADVLVVRISCDPITLTKGAPWYDVPERRACFRVAVDERIEPAPFLRYGSRALAARKLTAYLERRFAQEVPYE
jgi:1-acyl-sn-glycerol-3-phosphate acyltransferase